MNQPQPHTSLLNASRVARALAALIFGLLAFGCGGAPQPKPPAQPKDPAAIRTAADLSRVRAAMAAKRWDQLGRDCAAKLAPAAKRLACEAHGNHTEDSLIATLRDAPCGEILPVWRRSKPLVISRPGLLERALPRLAVRLGQCGNYAFVFQHLIHWGPHTVGAIGRKALEAMDRAELPVERAYLAWISEQSHTPYTPKTGSFALEHYFHWRLAKGGKIDCRPYAQAWQIIEGEDEMAWLYVFYRRTRCEAAADYVVQGLRAKRAKTRQRACMTLGRIGGRRHLPLLQVLAKSDTATRQVGKRKVFWVRQMCQRAMMQINERRPRLRGAPSRDRRPARRPVRRPGTRRPR